MHLSNEQIQGMERIYRLNLINSITGIKPANLIGTRSRDGVANVAIFSSVVHLGSNPALIGMVFRPQAETKRDTYQNILETEYYTINHVPLNKTQNAHFTSANFAAEESEFEKCAFSEEYLTDFPAPFVKESRIKLGMKLQQMIPIEVNGTVLAIGSVEHLFVPDDVLLENGFIDLGKAESAGISGVNSYYKLEKVADYPYAKPNELPDFGK
jgi:flavin reductase (DIM6/NTAB) family NADH-FMN oxidoreductase RutF